VNTLTLRSAADGWHFGTSGDPVDDIEAAGGLIEGDLAAEVQRLISEHRIGAVDIREDVIVGAGDVDTITAAAGRRTRSAIRTKKES
jgi:hypothetical protein